MPPKRSHRRVAGIEPRGTGVREWTKKALTWTDKKEKKLEKGAKQKKNGRGSRSGGWRGKCGQVRR